MLRKPAFDMQYALQRAARAAEIAANATSSEERETWLAVERGWLRLAQSCDLTKRVQDFIDEQDLRFKECRY